MYDLIQKEHPVVGVLDVVGGILTIAERQGF
jgi:hypothetical protein